MAIDDATNKLIDLIPVAATLGLVKKTGEKFGVLEEDSEPNDVFGFSDRDNDIFRKL